MNSIWEHALPVEVFGVGSVLNHISNMTIIGFLGIALISWWVYLSLHGCLVPNSLGLVVSDIVSMVSSISSNSQDVLVLVSLFMVIVFFNVVGLVPYSYALFSYGLFPLLLGFSIWLGSCCSGWLKLGVNWWSCLLPSGSPIGLSFLLVLIELTSLMASSVSIGMSLFINLLAGHILLSLVLGSGTGYLLIPSLLVGVTLFWLEFTVAVLQGYVFTVLASNYLG